MFSWYGMVLRLCKCLASGTWLRLRPFFSVPGFRHCKIWLRAKVGTTHTHPPSVTPCHSTIQSFICQSHFQLSIHPFIHPSNCLFTHQSIHPCFQLSIHSSHHVYIYIYIYLIICISSIFHCKSIDNNSLSIHNSFREYVLSNSLRISYLRFFVFPKNILEWKT